MNLCYFTFYPFFLAGVLRLPSAPADRQERARVYMDIGIVVFAAAIVLWYGLVRPVVLTESIAPARVMLTSGFLLGDLAMLMAALLLVFRQKVAPGKTIYRFLAGSAVVMIATDLAYAYQILGEYEGMATWIGLGFTTSHLLAGLAAVGQIVFLTTSQDSGPAVKPAEQPERAIVSMLMAYGALILAWVVHVNSHEERGMVIGVSIATSLILLVGFRQWLELRQNLRLYAEVSEARDDLEHKVEQRTLELVRARDDLELRVEERTEELQRTNLRLESANRELEAFAYSVSHDLRAPLRRMDGFSGFILDDYGDRLDEKGRHFLERIRAAAQRMGHLIDDLLRLSRLTKGELRPQEIELSEMARKITEELRASSGDRQVEFIIPDGLTVFGDLRLVRVALENLLGNAFKFTAEKACAVIKVGCEESEGETAFFVRDNGAGFDMEHADKLFGPFQRLHTGDRFQGSGIGLATVQRIIHRHGGRVWAEGNVDRGATFYFTLPRPGY
jgi:signal transduction histidine kinase